MPKTTTPPAPDAHYRRHLDGLRTVAVVLVIAFHSGIDRLSGGFIGVDVFFVLSGFLVTGILVRDLGSGRGVQWRRFYSRRVRRILPASVLTLVVTAVVYAAVASPLQQEDAFGGFRSAFLYIANWHFIQQSTDYFAADVDRNPVLHFWSLAVEEQFYLVWPFLFVGLCLATERIGRERWWMRRGVVLLAAVASAAAAVVIGDT
ncbi:MAG: acyltransferase family protein, partial [Actinomycetota bacterium]